MRILIVSNIPNENAIFAESMDNYSLGGELTKLGHDVHYLFDEDVPRWIPGRKLSPINFSLAFLCRLRQIERAHGAFDVVSVSAGDGCVYGIIRRFASRRSRGRFIGLSHGLEHRLWEQFREEVRLGRAWISPQHRVFVPSVMLSRVRLHIATCEHMVCRTNEDREYIIARGWKPASAVTHIPNGVRERFFADSVIARRRKGLLFVGRWVWRKGVHYLVEAFELVCRRHADVTLTVVGSLVRSQEVLRAFPPTAREKVRVVPTLSNAALVEEYLRHAIMVLPSLFEATPGVMLEAMAARIPVVTTRACGMNEVIEDGEDGMLVPRRDSRALADAITTLLADPGLGERIGAKAREKAQEYTWERIARRTEALYQRLLG